MKLKVRKEFEYNIKRSWVDVNPYTIAFIYPKTSDDSPFIVKGGLIDVKAFLKSYHIPFIGYNSHWYHHKKRGYWITNIRSLFFIPVGKGKRFRIIKIIFNKKVVKVVRRLPRKWIKELENFI